MCEAFTCAPDVAERQSWPLVEAILDYRNARYAVELMNQGQKGADELGRQPALQQLLLALGRAQRGLDPDTR